MSRWFIQSDTLDADIKKNFHPLIESARTTSLDTWTSTPNGSLALIILIDQFSRNIFRGTPKAFSGDPKALELATHAIVKGFDKQVPLIQQPFFYLPMMHSETLLGQIAGRAIHEAFATRCESDEQVRVFAKMGVEMCQSHLDVIERFGRFPARNDAIGRESTEAEKEFLRENPQGMIMGKQEGEA